MMQGIFAYGGTNNRRTLLSVVVLFVASVLLVMPYYFVYRAVTVLLDGGAFSPAFIAEHALIIGGLMIVQTVLYTKGLDLSHQAAYGTLMNLRLSLAEKLEKLPLGVTQQKGVGALKKIFTDDIDSFEVLLAHALPEGVSNALSTLLVLTAIFVCDWRLGLLVLAVIVLGMVPVMLMGSIGNKDAADYYNASRHMNNTIIEYVNGMEVVKVFNKTGESYARFTNAVNDYRDYTLRWYRACWPWMAAYTSILPCTLLFVLPVGAIMVMKNWVALPDFVLAICLALALGMPLLRTMSFVSVMPQIRYKLAELERVLDHQLLIEGVFARLPSRLMWCSTMLISVMRMARKFCTMCRLCLHQGPRRRLSVSLVRARARWRSFSCIIMMCPVALCVLAAETCATCRLPD